MTSILLVCALILCGCVTPPSEIATVESEGSLGEPDAVSDAVRAHQGITLIFAFPSSADLRPGSPVEFRRKQVGTVGDVEPKDKETVRATLLLDSDAAIPHTHLPFAYAQGGHDLLLPSVVFSLVPRSELASLYENDEGTLVVDFPYLDHEYSAFGRVRNSKE